MTRLEKLIVLAVFLVLYALASTVDAQGAVACPILAGVRHLVWWARFQADPWGNAR